MDLKSRRSQIYNITPTKEKKKSQTKKSMQKKKEKSVHCAPKDNVQTSQSL